MTMRVVIALGGNALLRRGEAADAATQRQNVVAAVEALAAVAGEHELIITHGNGPQVGLLALQGEAYPDVAPYPLDVLGAESEGMIGYLLDQELVNALGGRPVATLLTQVIVDEHDPAFADPAKFIGPVYDSATAGRLAAERGWQVRPDGPHWRRVVPSPEPQSIVELPTIRLLVEAGVLVVCVGGGGIPVLVDRDGRLRGVEAVIDKDRAAALLAVGLGADALLLLTDVAAVERGHGTPEAEPIAKATAAELRALDLPAGSMGPKADAAAWFADATGGHAAIGRLTDAAAVLEGRSGTTVIPSPARGRPAARRVLVAGSGVAAVEAVLALRHEAGRHFEIELLAPAHAMDHAPASVAAPFGLGAPPPLDLRQLAARYDVNLVEDELIEVDAGARRTRLASGQERPYDHLLVAVGARPRPGLAGALTFRGPADVPSMEWVLDEVRRGHRRQLAVVVPPGATWTMPAYELAIMAGAVTRDLAEATVTLLTPEREPLWLFGDAAGAALRELLAERGVALETGARAVRVTDDVLWLEDGRAIVADTVVSLPLLAGPGIPGLPADADGFLPTDAHGRVIGADGVLAAGDATTFPVKQGGLATQQADAAAATIAHELGAPREPRPFVPVLRGLLLTGGAPLYLRAELDAGGAGRAGGGRPRGGGGGGGARARGGAPGPVAGRYLAPYLSTARPADLGKEPMVDRAPGAAAPADPAQRDAALELALLMADEDAEAGDLAHALHALDAAAALSGGVLPAAYAERRARWLARLTPTNGTHR